MWAITLVCLCVLLDYSDAGVPRRDEEVFFFLTLLSITNRHRVNKTFLSER